MDDERARILIAEPVDFCPEAAHLLSSLGTVEMRSLGAEELPGALRDYDVCWFRLAHRIDRRLLQSSESIGGVRCRVLATPVTGLDHIDLAACADYGVKVVSLRGETEFLKTVRATAELTVGLALALMRRIPHASRSVLDGNWQRDLFRGCELYGKTAGLVGVGRLGGIVAGYLRAFGMNVIGYDPRPDFPHEAVNERAGSLNDLLRQADLVSLHVSYDDSTHHLMDEREFAHTKNGAVLINTSRGGVVNERALLAALRASRLAGAALDVIEGEPHLAPDNELLIYAREHENLLLVPHIGGNTRESFKKTEMFLAGRVVEALRASRRREETTAA